MPTGELPDTALTAAALNGTAPIDDRVARALALVDPADLVADLVDLLAVPSVTGSDAESELQHILQRRLLRDGLDTDLWQIDLPEITSDPAFPGLEAARQEAWGLVGATAQTHDGPTVIFNGHVDVVPPGHLGDWTSPPFTPWADDRSVYGRGACDMKGGLVCQLAALRVLREAGVRLRGQVLMQTVVGEEDGGLGTFATLRRGYTGDVAIISEPTSANLVTACGGALTFRLIVPGRSVHASARTSGVDAIAKYFVIAEELRRLESQRNATVHPLMERYDIAYPLSIGTIRAGDWASTVPDLLVAEGRLGVALGEDVDAARRALEVAVEQVCSRDRWLSQHPARVEWFGGQFAPGMLAPGHALERATAAAHTQLHGQRPKVYGAPYGSDMRLFNEHGDIPTIHYGPGDVRFAHAPNEQVPVAEMVTVTRTLVLLLARLCGTV